ncbi:zinc ribbon domain-containing protein, partial [Chloroflexota bacterium]
LEHESVEQTLSRIASQLGESQAVIKTQAELESDKKRLEESRQQQRSIEWDVDDLVNKLTTDEEKLYSGRIKNPKELNSLQHEVDGMKARRNQLEDRALEIMSQVEQAEASVATTSSELKKLKSEWRRQQKELSSEQERLKVVVSDLKQKWQTLASTTDPLAVEFYLERRGKKGIAIAKVEQGVCRACHISLTTTDLQKARGGNLVQCGSCGRILFLP